MVYVVVGAASVIAFIIRDLGDPGLAGWIIQVSTYLASELSAMTG